MLAKVKTEIGSVIYEFTIDEKSEIDTLHKVAVLGNPPKFCHVCNNVDPRRFKLDSNKDKEGNTYVNVVCQIPGCYAKAKLGLYKTGGFFWHKFVKFEKKETETLL